MTPRCSHVPTVNNITWSRRRIDDMGKNDKKGGAKGGGKDKGGEKESGGKGKAGAQVINVRHILVRTKDTTRDVGPEADAPTV